MKKITSIIFALVVLFAVICILPGCAKKSSVKVLRLAEIHKDDYSTTLGAKAMADYVAEKSNGTIKIEVYNNGVLGGEKETVEQTQTGDIHFVRVGVNLLSPLNPLMNALAMPYLFRDREHMFKVLDGPIGQELAESLQQQGLLGLCWMDPGFRNFYNSQREIKTPADLVGLKIRVQETPLMINLVNMLGGQATPMALPEVYTGIQNGVIHGAENNWPSYITTSHYEVAKFFTDSAHMASPEMILINFATWNSFTDEEKAIIKEGAMEGARVQRALWLEHEARDEARAKAEGSIITELTPEQRQLFVDALAPFYQQPAYADYAGLIQRVRDTK